jgi:hypothetical protein
MEDEVEARFYALQESWQYLKDEYVACYCLSLRRNDQIVRYLGRTKSHYFREYLITDNGFTQVDLTNKKILALANLFYRCSLNEI